MFLIFYYDEKYVNNNTPKETYMEKLFCRFCEKKTAVLIQLMDKNQVICNCGCHSPIRQTRQGAIQAWVKLHGNKRHRES